MSDPNSLGSLSEVKAADPFDYEQFLVYFLQYGIPYFATCLLAYFILSKIGYKFTRIYSLLAMIFKPLTFDQLHFMLRWVLAAVLVSPIVLLLLWGIQVVINVKAIIGALVLTCGGACLFAFFAFQQWKEAAFRFQLAHKVYFSIAAAAFVIFQLLVIFLIKPFSFVGVSSIFLTYNLVPIILIIYMNISGASIDFEKYVAASRQKGVDPTRSGGVESISAEAKRQLNIMNYLTSLAILIAYALIVEYVMPSSTTYNGNEISKNIGWVILATVIVLDVLVYMFYSAGLVVSPTFVITLCVLCRWALISMGAQMWFIAQSVVYFVFGVLLAYCICKKTIAVPGEPKDKGEKLQEIESVLKSSSSSSTSYRSSSSRASIESSLSQIIHEISSSYTNMLVLLTIAFLVPLVTVGKGYVYTSDVQVSSTVSGEAASNAIPQWLFGITSMLSVFALMCAFASSRYSQRAAALKPPTSQFPSFCLAFFGYLISVGNGLFLYYVAKSLIALSIFIFMPLIAHLISWIVSNLKSNDWDILDTSSRRPIRFWSTCCCCSCMECGSSSHDDKQQSSSSSSSCFSCCWSDAESAAAPSITLPQSQSQLTSQKNKPVSLQPQHQKPVHTQIKGLSPHTSSCFTSYISGGLTPKDYSMLWAVWALFALVAVWGALLSSYVTPIYLGWSLICGFYVLLCTAFAIRKWFATLTMGYSVALALLIAAISYVAYFMAMVLQTFEGKVTTTNAVAFIFFMILYPLVVLLGTTLYKWQDDQWRMSRFVFCNMFLCLGCFSVIVLVVGVTVSRLAGLLAALIYCIAIYFLWILVVWIQNRFYLPNKYRKSLSIVVGIIIAVSIGVGILSKYFFMGVSITLWCLIILSLGRSFALFLPGKGDSTQQFMYSKFIFPVYRYDALRDKVVSMGETVASAYFAMFTALLWGALATIFIDPAAIGLSVSSLAVLTAFSFTADKYFSQSLGFGRVVQYVTPKLVRKMLKKAAATHIGSDDAVELNQKDDGQEAEGGFSDLNDGNEELFGDIEGEEEEYEDDGWYDDQEAEEEEEEDREAKATRSSKSNAAKTKSKKKNNVQDYVRTVSHMLDDVIRKKNYINSGRIVTEDGRVQSRQEAYLELLELDKRVNRAYLEETMFAAHFQFLVIFAAIFKRRQKESELMELLHSKGIKGVTVEDIQLWPDKEKQKLFKEYDLFKKELEHQMVERMQKRQEDEAAQRRREEDAKRKKMGLPIEKYSVVSAPRVPPLPAALAAAAAIKKPQPIARYSKQEEEEEESEESYDSEEESEEDEDEEDEEESEESEDGFDMGMKNVVAVKSGNPGVSKAIQGEKERVAALQKRLQELQQEKQQLQEIEEGGKKEYEEEYEEEVEQEEQEEEEEEKGPATLVATSLFASLSLNGKNKSNNVQDISSNGGSSGGGVSVGSKLEAADHNESAAGPLFTPRSHSRSSSPSKRGPIVIDASSSSRLPPLRGRGAGLPPLPVVSSSSSSSSSVSSSLVGSQLHEVEDEEDEQQQQRRAVTSAPGLVEDDEDGDDNFSVGVSNVVGVKAGNVVVKKKPAAVAPAVAPAVPAAPVEAAQKRMVEKKKLEDEQKKQSEKQKVELLEESAKQLPHAVVADAVPAEPAEKKKKVIIVRRKVVSAAASVPSADLAQLEQEEQKIKQQLAGSSSSSSSAPVPVAAAAPKTVVIVKKKIVSSASASPADSAISAAPAAAAAAAIISDPSAATKPKTVIVRRKVASGEPPAPAAAVESTPTPLPPPAMPKKAILAPIQPTPVPVAAPAATTVVKKKIAQPQPAAASSSATPSAPSQPQSASSSVKRPSSVSVPVPVPAAPVIETPGNPSAATKSVVVRKKDPSAASAALPKLPDAPDDESSDHKLMMQMKKKVDDLIKECKRNGKPFEDPDFRCDESSVYSPWKEGAHVPIDNWLRPAVFLQCNPETANLKPAMFVDDADPADIAQGGLGDCWFLSALSVLALDKVRLRKLFITEETNEWGVYSVRFFKDGEWTQVIIDDRIPVMASGEPAFGRSKNENELWVMLLEKAYAKLHSSFEAMEGGHVHIGLVDMTGGVGQEMDFDDKEVQKDIMSGNLWSRLMQFKESGYLMGAGSPAGSDTDVSEDGIVQGHAYALLDAVELDEYRLVQLRNPWGHTEWKGKFSDDDPVWEQRRLRSRLQYEGGADDGTFWMPFEDFTRLYHSLYICRIFNGDKFHKIRFKSEWKGETAGGCLNLPTGKNNPQYLLYIEKPSTVFITLDQEDSRGVRADFFHICFMILKKDGKRAATVKKSQVAAMSGPYANVRQASKEIVLDPMPQPYTLIPSTFQAGCEAKFQLIIYSDTLLRAELAPATLEAI